MAIKWVFVFDEGNIAVDVNDEKEDVRIQNSLENVDDTLFIPGRLRDIYINLKLVKVVFREEVNEQAESPLQETAVPEAKSENS